MRAFVLAQIPYSHLSTAITCYQFALVRVDDDVINGVVVVVVALDACGSRVPDLDRAVFGACDHPFALTVKSQAGDVSGVAVECQDRNGIGGTDIEELDVMAAGCCEPSLVRRDA